MKYIRDGIIYNNVPYIRVGNITTVNPTNEQILLAGYEEYIEPEPSEPDYEVILSEAKNAKVEEIKYYDTSDLVNIFYIGDNKLWLDKETRAGLRLRFESEESVGRTQTTLWYNNECYQLSIEVAKAMLIQIEVYASDCYDTTARHIANVYNLETVEEVEEYDYMTDYPEVKHFPYNENDVENSAEE